MLVFGVGVVVPGIPQEGPPVGYTSPTRARALSTAAMLDAADGVMDGRFFGRHIRVNPQP